MSLFSTIGPRELGAQEGGDCRLGSEQAETCAVTSETEAIPESAPSLSAHHTVTALVAFTTTVWTRHGEGRGAAGGQRTRDFHRCREYHEPRVQASASDQRFEQQQFSAHGHLDRSSLETRQVPGTTVRLQHLQHAASRCSKFHESWQWHGFST